MSWAAARLWAKNEKRYGRLCNSRPTIIPLGNARAAEKLSVSILNNLDLDGRLRLPSFIFYGLIAQFNDTSWTAVSSLTEHQREMRLHCGAKFGVHGAPACKHFLLWFWRRTLQSIFPADLRLPEQDCFGCFSLLSSSIFISSLFSPPHSLTSNFSFSCLKARGLKSQIRVRCLVEDCRLLLPSLALGIKPREWLRSSS